MNNVYFNGMKETQSFLVKSKKIRDNVYLVDKKYVLKTYDDEYREKYGLNEEDLLKFKDIFIDGVSFIRGIVYSSDNYIFGTISEYVDGFSGENNSFKNIPIDKLLIAIKNLKKTIKELSELGIVIADPYDENIIFDGNKFTLIDMGECYYSIEDVGIVYKQNLINIMYELYNNIFSNNTFGIHTISRYLGIIHSKYADCTLGKDYLLMEPENLIIGIKEELEENLGIRINKFSDLDEYLSKLEFPEDKVMDFIGSRFGR